MTILDTKVDLDSVTVVHDLLKKANRYYQKGQMDLSVLCFNEVLEHDPENSIALYFLKLKRQQFEEELEKNSSQQLKFSQSIINKDYANAFKILENIRNKDSEDSQYNEIKDIISKKLEHKILTKVGDIEQLYITVDKDITHLTHDEIQIFNQFRRGSTPKEQLEITSMRPLRILTILNKLISEKFIIVFNQKKNNLIQLKVHSKNKSNSKTVQQNKTSAANDETYESLFKKATAAYVRRNYKESLALYSKCQLLQPDNSKVNHNIKKLKQRLS